MACRQAGSTALLLFTLAVSAGLLTGCGAPDRTEAPLEVPDGQRVQRQAANQDADYPRLIDIPVPTGVETPFPAQNDEGQSSLASPDNEGNRPEAGAP